MIDMKVTLEEQTQIIRLRNIAENEKRAQAALTALDIAKQYQAWMIAKDKPSNFETFQAFCQGTNIIAEPKTQKEMYEIVREVIRVARTLSTQP